MEVFCEKILVQFVSQGGEASFPPVEVLKDISPSIIAFIEVFPTGRGRTKQILSLLCKQSGSVSESCGDIETSVN